MTDNIWHKFNQLSTDFQTKLLLPSHNTNISHNAMQAKFTQRLTLPWVVPICKEFLVQNQMSIQCVQDQYNVYKTNTMCTRPIQCVQHQYNVYKTNTMCTTPIQCVQHQYNVYNTNTMCTRLIYRFKYPLLITLFSSDGPIIDYNRRSVGLGC